MLINLSLIIMQIMILIYLLKCYHIQKIHHFLIGFLIIGVFSFFLVINAISLDVLILAPFLALIFIIDWNEQWIPDLSIIIIFVVNLIKIGLNLLLGAKFCYDGLIFCILFIIIIILLQVLLKKELMGFGDLKLLFVLCIGRSFLYLIMLLLFASIIGLIYSILLKRRKIAFGPFIVLSYLISIILIKYL